MKNVVLHSIVSFVVAIVIASAPRAQAPGQSGTSKEPQTAAALSHTLDGVWASKVARTVPRLQFECCAVDPKLRPPMTPWGQMRWDAAVPSSGDRVIPGKENDPALFCKPNSFPKILTSPEPFEIITIPGRVLMFFEKDHGSRQIWTDGRPLPKDPEPRWDGYSIGRWEGDTFVVESSGFNDETWLDYYGDPHSEALHLTERYRRVSRDVLSIAVTIEDPIAYTKPWVGQPMLYSLRPGLELQEWYCTLEDQNLFDQKVRFPTFVPGADKK